MSSSPIGRKVTGPVGSLISPPRLVASIASIASTTRSVPRPSVTLAAADGHRRDAARVGAECPDASLDVGRRDRVVPAERLRRPRLDEEALRDDLIVRQCDEQRRQSERAALPAGRAGRSEREVGARPSAPPWPRC